MIDSRTWATVIHAVSCIGNQRITAPQLGHLVAECQTKIPTTTATVTGGSGITR